MKKRICLLMAVCLLLTLAACGHGHPAAETPQGSETVQIANPWRDITQAEAKTLCPGALAVPDGAENVQWSAMDAGADPSGAPGALVQLAFDWNGNRFTAREQLTGDSDADISGMYYDWSYQTEEPLKSWADGTLTCRCFRFIGEEGYADLCAWSRQCCAARPAERACHLHGVHPVPRRLCVPRRRDRDLYSPRRGQLPDELFCKVPRDV